MNLLSSRPTQGFGLAVLAGVLIIVAVAVAARAASRTPEAVSTLGFQSGGRLIKVEYFPVAADAPARKSAVLILHGAGGVVFDGPGMRRMARYLAGAGHPTYFVHYFERTGSIAVNDSRMRAHFDDWLATVREAISWVRTQEPAAGKAVAVYGYSLGAFLGLAASSSNREVGAVVEHAGGIWYGQRERLRDLPPVLMVHGREDARVPYDQFAVPLQQLLKERGAAVTLSTYPQEGHRFSQAAEEKVRVEAARFLADHPGR